MLLQSRLSSSRLPGKALLPLAGLPLMGLAAARATNRGGALTIITSTAPSDDPLDAAARSRGLAVYRGDLDDVLARSVGAVAHLPDDAIALRLTGDNPVPDQALAETVAGLLVSRGVDYAAARWPDCDLPYGLAVEAFRVGALRRANENARTTFDRENTTPWLRRNVRCAVVEDYQGSGFARLRCTVDSLDDYLDMVRLFDGHPAPILAPWLDLVGILHADPAAPSALLRSTSYFGIWGNDPDAVRISEVVVDATNSAAALGPTDAVQSLRAAIERGVTHLIATTSAREANRKIGRALAGGWSSRTSLIVRITAADATAPLVPVLELFRDLGVSGAEFAMLPADTRAASLSALEDLGAFRRMGIWGNGLLDHDWQPSIVCGRQPERPEIPVIGGNTHRIELVR